MNWLEVSLTVNGELAEAVADVLARFAPNGVVAEQGVKFLGEEDEGTGAGPITVRAYLADDDKLEATRRRIEESLYYLGLIQPLPAPEFKAVADQNWMEAWKQHYRPIPIGQRLIVIPAWLDPDTSGRVPIKIDPGMAFGTGTHPSTQLCLELIEDAILPMGRTPEPGERSITCIDVGCGSGILAIAALKLGAHVALGVDIDSQSVKNARDNAAANGIGSELILGLGSVKEILQGRFALRQANVVAVNILAPVIVRLFEAQLAELVEPGGTMVLGGILAEQAARVLEAGEAVGLRLAQKKVMGDWVALAMHRQ